MNKDPLTDYLKVTQLVLLEYHPLRIIAEGVSKGLIEQKLQTIQDNQDNKDYWVREYKDAVKFSQRYPQSDFSTFINQAKNQIDECNKAIEVITQETLYEEAQIKLSDEKKRDIKYS